MAVHWPTYRQSKIIVVVLNASIALNCVLYVLEDKPITGTLAFTLTASYVRVVHRLPHLVIVLTLAMIPIGMRVVELALEATSRRPGRRHVANRLGHRVAMTIRTLVQLLGDTAPSSPMWTR